MARVFTITANRGLTINNGVAYSCVAGGAVSFIPEDFGWFTGNNATQYFNMLRSRGHDVSEIVCLVAQRAALIDAAANHAADVTPLLHDGHLVLNMAEVINDAGVTNLTNYAKLDPAQHNAAHAAALVAHPDAAVPAAGWAADRLSDRDAKALEDPDLVLVANACARLTYSTLAVNAIGLITSGHHLRGAAEGTYAALFRMYELGTLFKSVGVTERQMLSLLGHDSLHPVAYANVATWGQNIPVPAAAKIAAPVMLRLPAYPGGTSFVKNAVHCRSLIVAAPVLATIGEALDGTAANTRLDALNTAIRANPLDYSSLFRPGRQTAITQECDAVAAYAAMLFGVYEAYIEHAKLKIEGGEGPTGGPGMKKFKSEHISAYETGKRAGTDIIAENAGDLPAGLEALRPLLA
jgi:hypothetical protein